LLGPCRQAEPPLRERKSANMFSGLVGWQRSRPRVILPYRMLLFVLKTANCGLYNWRLAADLNVAAINWVKERKRRLVQRNHNAFSSSFFLS